MIERSKNPEYCYDVIRTVILWDLPAPMYRAVFPESSWPEEFYSLDHEDIKTFTCQLANAFNCKVTVTEEHKSTIHKLGETDSCGPSSKSS